MSDNLIVRSWREGDAAGLAEIFRRSVREVASRDYRPAQIAAWTSFADDRAAWKQRMDSREVWVAEQDGRPVGFIQFEPPGHIDLTYVHPGHQRRGVASALLAKVEATALENGVAGLTVEASITSRVFFTARGFETIAPQIVTARGQDFLNYRMAKRLG
jgi:putative acetyltransferase